MLKTLGDEIVKSPKDEVNRHSLRNILNRAVDVTRTNAGRVARFCSDIMKKCVDFVTGNGSQKDEAKKETNTTYESTSAKSEYDGSYEKYNK